MKKWIIYTVIALVLLLLIVFAILLLWKWKTKKSNQELKSKIYGGVELEDIIKEIKEKINKQTENQQLLGFYNLTSDICYNLNIKLDYLNKIPVNISSKLKGSNTEDRYIIVNGKRIKLKDYVEELINKNKLNTETIKVINEHNNEALQYVEQYEEDEAEFYVEQTLKETDRLYEDFIDTISEQRENFNEKTITSEKVEEIEQQINKFKEMDARLILIDQCYDDIFSMRNDLQSNKEKIAQKHDELLKLIIYVEMYYEMEDLKKEHTYLPTKIEFDESKYNSTDTINSCYMFDDCNTSECITCSENLCSLDTLLLQIDQQINVCTNQEYLNETLVDTSPIKKEEIISEDFSTTQKLNALIDMSSIINSISNVFKLYYKYSESDKIEILEYTDHEKITIDESNKKIENFMIKDYLNKSITNDNYHLKKININDESRHILFIHYTTNDIQILYNNQIKSCMSDAKNLKNYVKTWDNIL